MLDLASHVSHIWCSPKTGLLLVPEFGGRLLLPEFGPISTHKFAMKHVSVAILRTKHVIFHKSSSATTPRIKGSERAEDFSTSRNWKIVVTCTRCTRPRDTQPVPRGSQFGATCARLDEGPANSQVSGSHHRHSSSSLTGVAWSEALPARS